MLNPGWRQCRCRIWSFRRITGKKSSDLLHLRPSARLWGPVPVHDLVFLSDHREEVGILRQPPLILNQKSRFIFLNSDFLREKVRIRRNITPDSSILRWKSSCKKFFLDFCCEKEGAWRKIPTSLQISQKKTKYRKTNSNLSVEQRDYISSQIRGPFCTVCPLSGPQFFWLPLSGLPGLLLIVSEFALSHLG